MERVRSMALRKEYNDTVSLAEFKKLRAEGDSEYAEKKNRAKRVVVKKDHGSEGRWLDGCRCSSCGKARRNARQRRSGEAKRNG